MEPALGTIAPCRLDRPKCGECVMAGKALMNRRIADGKVIINNAAIFYFISRLSSGLAKHDRRCMQMRIPQANMPAVLVLYMQRIAVNTA